MSVFVIFLFIIYVKGCLFITLINKKKKMKSVLLTLSDLKINIIMYFEYDVKLNSLFINWHRLKKNITKDAYDEEINS